MTFYAVMMGAMVVGTLVAAALAFFTARLLAAWLPHAWDVARDWHALARRHGRAGGAIHIAAWVGLFPLMLAACLGAALARLVRMGEKAKTAYLPHLLPDPARPDDKTDED